jgi:hypothetical protein
MVQITYIIILTIWYNLDMKAKLLFKEKNLLEDGCIMELVLWELPVRTKDRPHGYKYRLYFGDNKCNCLVRYDNESGKGDHKHISKKEIAYEFVDRNKLIEDFYHDVIRCHKK